MQADVALSVLMTTVSTCAAPIMTPLLTSLLAGSLVPVAAGIANIYLFLYYEKTRITKFFFTKHKTKQSSHIAAGWDLVPVAEVCVCDRESV